jgi:hypothetical protein
MTFTPPTPTARPYARPAVHRFGTFREITREGFTGNLDGGLILGPDGSTTPAGDDTTGGGSR